MQLLARAGAMAEGIFDFVAEQLERASDLDRLESRGTLRLALRRAGLDPKTLSEEREMRVVLEKVLPGELEARGVPGAASVCASLAEALRGFVQTQPAGRPESSPDAIFRRIGGD